MLKTYALIAKRRLLLLRCVMVLITWVGSTAARADLLLYYDFDEVGVGDQVPDRSGKKNDGVRVGTEYSADRSGHTGKAGDRAMDFLGFQDHVYLDIPTAADGAFDPITKSDSFTISVWVNGSEEAPVDGTVLWFAGDNQRQIIAHVPWSDSIIYFDMAGCDSCLYTVEPDPAKFKEKWNHYAFVKNQDMAAIYQNGQLLAEAEGMGMMDAITTARFGTFANDAYPYSGLLDDIAIWDKALDAATIAGIAAGSYPIVGGKKGDFNLDGVLDAADIDALTVAALSGQNLAAFDLNSDQRVDDVDRGVWVRDLKVTYFGDANLDGLFTTADFVSVFQVGEYEDAVSRNSGWSDGDWNGDRDFTSGDFVTAFQDGGFEKGPRTAVSAVPEPASQLLLLGALLPLADLLRRRPGR
jgi:hypothetical protein